MTDMEFCPHCGSPGVFDDAQDQRCSICGMSVTDESMPVDHGADSSPDMEPAAAASDFPSSLAEENATSDLNGPERIRGGDDDFEDEQLGGKDLIRPRQLSPEFARRVTAAWRQTAGSFRNASETLKSQESCEANADGVRIGRRDLSRPGLLGGHEQGDYELTEVIGEGAMGNVWSARQTSLNREVAIKTPKGSSTSAPSERQRFMAEVVVTGQLDHPNIVPIYELGQDASGMLFYSMKRVEGREWSELLSTGKEEVGYHLDILMKVCDAVRFAHDRGVIHRDIKPQNVMVGRYGEVSVMDWGIAVQLDKDAGSGMPLRVSPAGTPAYMAPEMATGASAEIGPATDVYLLGAVLYEVLTGSPPHPAPKASDQPSDVLTDALLIAARNDITPIDGEGELVDIVYKALATNTEERYQSVEEFQEAVHEYLSHAESTKLAERGVALLDEISRNGNGQNGAGSKAVGLGRFDAYDRARFAFEESLEIWPSNRLATSRLEQTLLAYAAFAYDQGAYARGIALLDDDNPDHRELLRRLRAAQLRTSSLSSLLKAAVLLIIVGGGAFTFFLYQAWGEAGRQRDAAVDQQAVAKQSEAEANRQAEIARLNAAKAAKQEQKAREQELIAKASEQKAREQQAIATQNAEQARKNAVVATRNAAEAEAASYAFEIGLAAEDLRRNAFDRASQLLVSQAQNPAKSTLRNWEWGHLQSQVEADNQLFGDQKKPLKGRVEAAAVSADGQWIAAGCRDGDLYVWRADRSQKPARLHYGTAVNALAFTPDGSALLSAGHGDGNRHPVSVWSLPVRDGAKPDRALFEQAAPILSLDVSPDTRTVLSTRTDGVARLTPIKNPEDAREFLVTSQENSVYSAKFSPDGEWIVTGGEDGAVRIWNTIATGAGAVRESRRFDDHEGPVYAAVFSPDGQTVLSGGRDRRLLARPFNPEQARRESYSSTDEARRRLQEDKAATAMASAAVAIGEHDAAIRCLSFAAGDSILFSAGDDHTIRAWDIGDGWADVKLNRTLRGHGGWVRVCAPMPNDPERILSGGYDRRVRVWNWRRYAFPVVLSTQGERDLGDSQLTCGTVSPDGRWVATASSNGVLYIWDLHDPSEPKIQQLAEGHAWQATSGVYFAGGRRLLTAGGDNTALVWDVENGDELVRMGGWQQPVGTGWRGVASVTADGKLIATGAQGDVLARVWDASTGTLIASLATPAASGLPEDELPEATAIAWSPDGKTLVVGDQWGACYRSAGNHQQVRTWAAHEGKVVAIRWLADGTGLLTAGNDRVVYEWSNKDQPERIEALQHRDRVVSMALANDEETLVTASGSDDSQAVLRVWKRSRPDTPVHTLASLELFPSQSAEERSTIRSVAVHPNRSEALVTVFDPVSSTYRIGVWTWGVAKPFRTVGARRLRDVATAIYAPHRENAMLVVGGRGARLQTIGDGEVSVAMTYRPQSTIQSIAFDPAGKTLLAGSTDGTLKLWKLAPDQSRWEPSGRLVGGHKASINSVVFQPVHNDCFLTASDDGSARLWRFIDGGWAVTDTFTPEGDRLSAIHRADFVPTLNAESRVVLVGAAGGYLWEEPNVAPQKILDEACTAVTSTPDGRWIAVGVESEARLYNTETLQLSAEFLGHSAGITSLEFTADGSRLFTASRDYTAKLWDTRGIINGSERLGSQRELLTLEGHNNAVTSVTIASGVGDPYVLTTGLDGQAIVWPSQKIAPLVANKP